MVTNEWLHKIKQPCIADDKIIGVATDRGGLAKYAQKIS